jgi:hypothetical protein
MHEAQERQLEAQIAQVEINETRIEKVIELCNNIAEGVDLMDFNDKQHLIELLDLRGMVYRTRRQYAIEITGILPEPLTVTGEIKGRSV